MDISNRRHILMELGVKEDILLSIQNYMNLLWKTNEKLNLVSRKMTIDEFIDNHVVDSFLPLKYFPKDKVMQVADFGSGGGLPGVLFALQFPKMHFHLFEKSPKKQDFLRECQRNITPNITIHGEINPSDISGVDLIMARAFKPLDVLIEVSRDYFLSGGAYFLFKGRKDKIEEEILIAQKKFKDFKEIKAQIIPLHSPTLEVERHLVVI